MRMFVFLLFLSFNLFAREVVLVEIEAETARDRSEIANYIHIDTVQKGFITAHVNNAELIELQKNLKKPIKIRTVLYTGTQEFMSHITADPNDNKIVNPVLTLKRKIMVQKGKEQEIPLETLLAGFDIINSSLKLSEKPDQYEVLELKSSSVLKIKPKKDFNSGVITLTAQSSELKQSFKVDITVKSF